MPYLANFYGGAKNVTLIQETRQTNRENENHIFIDYHDTSWSKLENYTIYPLPALSSLYGEYSGIPTKVLFHIFGEFV